MAGAGTSGRGSNKYCIKVLSCTCKSIPNNTPRSQAAEPPRQNLLNIHMSIYSGMHLYLRGPDEYGQGHYTGIDWSDEIQQPRTCPEMINHGRLSYQVFSMDCSPAEMWPVVSPGQLPADENFQTSTGHDSEVESGQRFPFWEITLWSLLEPNQGHDPISVLF